MGVPGSSTGDVFHAWAQLPIPRGQFDEEQKEEQRVHFPECKPLPGAKKLLRQLNVAHNDGKKIQIALATSTRQMNYDLKTQSAETRELLANFDDNKRILWDDPRLANARGKPASDIFLLALRSINESLEE